MRKPRRMAYVVASFLAMITVVPVMTHAEPVSASVSASSWVASRSRTALGGKLLSASTTGASASFKIRRKRFAMWYVAGPSQGKLAVLVNGRRVKTIDQYSSRVVRRAVSLRGSKSTNLVQVVALSTRNSRSRGTKVNVDAFSPTTARCSSGCQKNPLHIEVGTAPVIAFGEAAWYPTAVPARADAEWAVAVGSYVRGQDVTPIDTAVPVIRAAACDQAKKVPRGIIVLSFGKQIEGGSNGFGRTIPYSSIVATASAWAAGLAE
ncbi:MAG: hypothetical protein ACO3JF_09175, partial [Ilumatobacteraceae bacterium]